MSVGSGDGYSWRMLEARVLAALPLAPPDDVQTNERYFKIVRYLRDHAESSLNPDADHYLEGRVIEDEGLKLVLEINSINPIPIFSKRKTQMNPANISKRMRGEIVPIRVKQDEKIETYYIDPKEIAVNFSRGDDTVANIDMVKLFISSNKSHSDKSEVFSNFFKRFIYTQTVTRIIREYHLRSGDVALFEKCCYNVSQICSSPEMKRQLKDVMRHRAGSVRSMQEFMLRIKSDTSYESPSPHRRSDESGPSSPLNDDAPSSE